jgi:hypothetical protein
LKLKTSPPLTFFPDGVDAYGDQVCEYTHTMHNRLQQVCVEVTWNIHDVVNKVVNMGIDNLREEEEEERKAVVVDTRVA